MTKEHRNRLDLNKNVFYIGLTSFFTDTSTKMVYSVMPLFLLSIGASKTVISLIEGIAESTASLLKFISGFWSDKIGRSKPFMIIGYGVTAIVTPLYALAKIPFHILALRFTERVGKGLRAAPRDKLIGDSVDKKDAGKNFGFHKAMDNSGAIIGPLLAALLLIAFPHNYRLIFIWAAIPAFIGVITIIFLIKDTRRPVEKENNKFKINQLPRRFYIFIFIVFIFTLGNSTDALLLVKSSEVGVKDAWVPFIYMLFNTVSVIFSLPIGILSDKIGREKLIFAGFMVYALTYLFFGLSSKAIVLILLFIPYGFYSALSDTSQKAFISDIVGKDLKGTAFGIYHAVLGITLLPASLIAGKLYDSVGNGAPFYFGAAMAFLASLLMLIFIFTKNHQKNKKIVTLEQNFEYE